MNSVLTELPLISACSEDAELTENPETDFCNKSRNSNVGVYLLAQMLIAAKQLMADHRSSLFLRAQ